MSRQVESLPELMEQQYDDLEPKTRKVLSFQEIYNIQRIILTGCGDSLAAAMATKHAFEMLTGIPTEVVTAIELGRFYCENRLPEPAGDRCQQFGYRGQGVGSCTEGRKAWVFRAGSDGK